MAIRQKGPKMGSTKLLQFRLDFDAYYDARWQSLNDAIAEIAPNRWDESTASFLFQHPNTVFELLDAVKFQSSIYVDGRDMVMIMDLESHEVVQIGVKNPALLMGVIAAGRTGRQVA
ncbi:hypothetical protein [Devosia marina]|nr:hypothetical protein [Devosia marina]